MKAKVTASVPSFSSKTCGDTFSLTGVSVKSEIAKLDGRLELRGVTTPITVAKDATESLTVNGGTYDCSKDLAATLTIQSSESLGKGVLFSKQFEPKGVTFAGANNAKQTIAPHGGFVALSVSDTSCGSPIKATVFNKLEGKTGGPGPAVRLVVTGNGVTRTSGAYGGTQVELGTLDCTKGAPSFTLTGDVAAVTISPGKVQF